MCWLGFSKALLVSRQQPFWDKLAKSPELKCFATTDRFALDSKEQYASVSSGSLRIALNSLLVQEGMLDDIVNAALGMRVEGKKEQKWHNTFTSI